MIDALAWGIPLNRATPLEPEAWFVRLADEEPTVPIKGTEFREYRDGRREPTQGP
jgi:hypothetical protein